MDLFDVLTLIGGLSLFLFGMNLMGSALERRAGGRLQSLLNNMNIHASLRVAKTEPLFQGKVQLLRG